jgi:ABC-type glycerol-3-phosphate transport system permease component
LTKEKWLMQLDLAGSTKRQGPVASWLGTIRLRGVLRLAILYLLAGFVSLICLIPIIWMIKTSFETPEFMRSAQIQLWPIQPTLDNYRHVLTNPNAMIGRSTLNSLMVATAATLVNILLTAPAGYTLSRFKFRGKLIFGLYLLTFYMIPRTLLLIGTFGMLADLGLINNLLGLVIVYAVTGIPLATWWLKAYFDSIPIEIEEQAMIDGANRLSVLRWIVMPLALPGVAAVGIFQFIDAWNEYVLALTIIQSPQWRLLPVQIVNFMGLQRIEWGPVMAFSVIVALPAVILFAFVQRNIIGGLMSGFTK